MQLSRAPHDAKVITFAMRSYTSPFVWIIIRCLWCVFCGDHWTVAYNYLVDLRVLIVDYQSIYDIFLYIIVFQFPIIHIIVFQFVW